MKQVVTTALLLKRINYHEADRILTVITPQYGKVSLLAKGVRRPKSKLAGGLELFSTVELTYIDGRSDLKTVVSTRLKEHYKHIITDITKTTYAYDFLKLIDGLSQDDCDEQYFNLLQKGLECLNNQSISAQVCFVWFIQQLAQLNGSAMNLEKPLDSESFSQDKQYQFSFDDMAFFAQDSSQYGPNHIKFLRLGLQATTPAVLQNVQSGADLAAELEPLMKQSMAYIQQG